ncbi:MAG: hypothetical protein JO306_15345 [Gemmatimonadetes bacterium]|nr:hypothetical protein [Gemmatimonadota bacterium]
MKKLKLDLGTLEVEGFSSAPPAGALGTVEGQGLSRPTVATIVCDTCHVSCNYTACPVDCS